MTVETIISIAENQGLTFRNGKSIRYKSGWQVATEGIETKSPTEALKAILAYGGNCGIWFADGIYYVDKSHRVNTKKEALEIGKIHNQISVYGWARGNLAYC